MGILGSTYSSVGPAIPGYSVFLQNNTEAANEVFKEQVTDLTPRAEVFILANDYRSTTNQAEPDMPANLADSSKFVVEPLFWLSRCRGASIIVGCGLANAEFTVALRRELDAFNVLGYELRGRMGFVIACRLGENCGLNLPTNSALTRIERYWNSTAIASADSALITANNAAQFLGYSNAAPAGVPGWPFVYAFTNSDSDSDQVIQAQELLSGLNEQTANSDCEGSDDGVEFPMAGISPSDPMSGSICADRRVRIFLDGDKVKLEMQNFGPATVNNVKFYFQASSQLTVGNLDLPLPSGCVQMNTPLKYPVPGPGPRKSIECTFASMPAGTVQTVSFTTIAGMPYPSQAANYLGEVSLLGTPSTDAVTTNNSANFVY